MNRPELESAMVGGVIVCRRLIRPLGPRLKQVQLQAEPLQHLLEVASNMSACGLDADDDYVIHIASALRFERRSTAALFAALLAFEQLADVHPGWTLSDLVDHLLPVEEPATLPALDEGHWTEIYDR